MFDVSNQPEIKAKIAALETSIKEEEKYKKMTPEQQKEEIEIRKELLINQFKKEL
jgi:hypothetical protein